MLSPLYIYFFAVTFIVSFLLLWMLLMILHCILSTICLILLCLPVLSRIFSLLGLTLLIIDSSLLFMRLIIDFAAYLARWIETTFLKFCSIKKLRSCGEELLTLGALFHAFRNLIFMGLS